jgi:hypothetical protein
MHKKEAKMNSTKKISKFIAFSFILVLGLSPLAAFASDVTQQEVFSDTQLFYTKTEKGTLALKLEEKKYIHLAPNQKYDLDSKGEYEFIVNHRSTTTSDYSYLAVEVIRVFPPDRDFQTGFALKRNDGWVRTSGDPVLNQNEYWNESIGLQKFRSIHEKDDPVYADKKLGFKWHAKPHSNSQSSWAQHKWWAEPIPDNEADDIKMSLMEKINNESLAHGSFRLYRFREMDKGDTKNHLTFTVESHSCSDLFIRTYSPISKEYSAYYHFVVK